MASTAVEESSEVSSKQIPGESLIATTSKTTEPNAQTIGHESSNRQEQQQQQPESEKRNDNPTVEEDDESQKFRGMKLYVLCAAVVFSTFLMSLNGSIVATVSSILYNLRSEIFQVLLSKPWLTTWAQAIPQITSQFNSLDDIGWYGSAYLISTCSMQPLVGKIYTHFPTKQTYIIFNFILAMGSVVCATAISSNMLIAGRSIQGIGGAGVVNGAFSTITAATPRDIKPLVVGIGVALSSIGTVVGPLVGGALTQSASWHWCFYINLPFVGSIIAILLLLKIPEQTEKPPVRENLKRIIKQELDLLGFCLFAPTCVMFLLAIIWGGHEYAWNSSVVIGLFCGAFATLSVFVAWELYRGDHAMIPPNIARRKLVIFGCITSCFQMGSLMVFSYFMPLWFQVVKDASPVMSGVMILPTALSQGIGSVSAGQFVRVVGYCTAWALFGCVLTSIGSGLMTTFTVSSGAGAWIGYQILVGLGRGSVIQMPVTAIQNLLPGREVAIATSSIFFFQYLGGAMFLAIGQTIFGSNLLKALQAHAPSVNAEEVIEAGATAIRSTVSSTALDGVVQAYNQAITHTFYLSVGGTCAAFLSSFGMGWQRLPRTAKKKTANKEGSVEESR